MDDDVIDGGQGRGRARWILRRGKRCCLISLDYNEVSPAVMHMDDASVFEEMTGWSVSVTITQKYCALLSGRY